MKSTKEKKENSSPIYTSKLLDWDTRASVRVKPRRVLHDEEVAGKVYFLPELVSISSHPIIHELGSAFHRRTIIQHLYRYLDFTTVLEHEAVNEVATEIVHRRIGIELPEEMRFDAHKLYVDEGYHALFSDDLKRQVEDVTGVTPNPVATPLFLQRLSEIQASQPSELRDLIRVFFVIVSETLISGTLKKIPKDPRVVSTVRTVIDDHAKDEALHHVYFSSLMEFLWPQLSPNIRGRIGPLLPQLILGFLLPDYPSIARELSLYGLRQDEIQQVIDESYPPAQVMACARDAAKATLRLFERNGVLEDMHTADAFQESGLIV